MTETTFALFGCSSEMDCLGIKRRPGSENGPSQLIKGLRLCNYTAINDPGSLYLDLFELVGTSSTSFSSEGFRSKLRPVLARLQASDTAVCVGGGSNALAELLGVCEQQPDFILKVSPHLSRASAGEQPHNLNYLSHLDQQTRSRVVHFGAVDYLASQEEVDRVAGEDKAKIVFFEKYSAGNLANFSAVLAAMPAASKVYLLLDCESLDSSFFPGVSNPGVFGFSQQEAVGMVAALRASDKLLPVVVIANYNPTVEPRRSAEFLTFLIYNLLKCPSKKNKVNW